MNLNINDFTGPWDLLLHMVKSHKMDIYDIDIKIIIDEYIEFINSLNSEDLDNKSEYLVMASELVHLKSKTLLGFDDEEDDANFEINSEDTLKQRLIEYEKYQNISNDFRTLEENRKDYYTKVPESLKEFAGDTKITGNMDIELLIKAFLDLQERNEYKKPRVTKVTTREVSITEKTSYIRNYLKDNKKVEFTSLFEDISKEDMVVTFLSILEMTKNQEVLLSQDENFSKIFIEAHYE